LDIISSDRRLPLYYQLYDIISKKIKEGIYQEDDKLPSEREFCEEYDISRATVRRTMVELEKNNLIYKKQGKGVFVSPEAFEQDLLNFYSFTDEMKKINKKPTSKIIDFKLVAAAEKIIAKLNLQEDDKVYQIKRLRLADNEPMMLETTFLPAYRFENLTEKELSDSAMYDIFRKKFDVVFAKAEETFQATSINSEEAMLLDVKENSPAILLERLTYETNSIIEYTVSIARGDKFKFHVVLE
jgi:GntR family transcriptional regulator